MSSNWVFMALAALSGILISLELNLIALLILSLGIIRIARWEKRNLFLLYCLIMLIFFLISEHAISSTVSYHNSPDKMMAVPITFKEYPQFDGNRLRAIADTPQKEKFMLIYKISTEKEKVDLNEKLRAGTTCMMNGKLIRPEPNRNEHAFNYEEYLKRMNVHWIFEPDTIGISDCHLTKITVMAALQNLRQAGIDTIENKFPERLASYTAALLFGERSLISEETDRSYKQLGVVHLLAISGLHVGIIAGGVFFLCLRIGMTRESVFWLLIFFLPIYAVLSGGNPPVIRAVIMALLLLVSKKWRLSLSTLDTFSLSFILFLLFDPFLIYNIGFQLSYAVSFGLTLSPAYLFNKREHVVWKMANLSIVSVLSSLPILSYHFFEFSLISIVANLLFVPFYTLVLLPSVFFMFALSFTELQAFHNAALILDQLVLLSEILATAAAQLPFSVFLTGRPSTLSVIFMVVSIFTFFVFKEKDIHPLVCVLPLVLTLTLHSVWMKYSPSGEVVFIDVGQGDSVLIKLPYNRGVYLIDTGGQLSFPIEEWQERRRPYKIGRDTLIPFLKSKGIRRIDKLILTHSDTDHIGAAEELIGEIKIGEILISPNSWVKPIMAGTLDKAMKANINVKEIKAGYGWENKSGIFHMVYPFDDEYEGNDDSLVLYASFGGLRWLFTGDLEKEGEKEMGSAYGRLKTDVLKVGHHGSRGSTSTAFIEMVRPEYAIISAGKSNRYGHPHLEVLEILEGESVQILRTDEHGAIHFRFTSKGGTFKTVLP
ncbi:DNA internalization-related competence protein ComEC/Rec2 [Bacillus freudenreichii]|nr:DNA internalization-related competence protein ComEC/Rec2 [Bacillus freudenreichii]